PPRRLLPVGVEPTGGFRLGVGLVRGRRHGDGSALGPEPALAPGRFLHRGTLADLPGASRGVWEETLASPPSFPGPGWEKVFGLDPGPLFARASYSPATGGRPCFLLIWII